MEIKEVISSECPICLENMEFDTLIGQVNPCNHYYHSQCIEQWTSQSNSCPTCRKSFYRVDVRHMRSQKVISSFRVQDKLAENAAIDEIPSEFVLPPTAPSYVPQEIHTDALSGVCIICSSAQYSVRELFACIACGGTFHSHCLGYGQEGYWFCPVCDYQMERSECRLEAKQEDGQPSWSGQSPRKVPTRASRASNQSSSGQKLLRSIGIRTQTGPDQSASGQKLLRSISLRTQTAPKSSAREKPFFMPPTLDLDDNFSDEEADCVQVTSSGRARVLENGGVRLRRQARELQSLSLEEVQSWQILESARQGIEACVEKEATAPGVSRKKRTRASPKRDESKEREKDCSFELSSGSRISNGSTSRISSLMKQIRSREGNVRRCGLSYFPIEVGDSASRKEDKEERLEENSEIQRGMSGSEEKSEIQRGIQSSEEKSEFQKGIQSSETKSEIQRGTQSSEEKSETQTEIQSSEQKSEYQKGIQSSEQKYSKTQNKKTNHPSPELSLEQKRLVQSHVRELLRPHYQVPNADGVPSPIRSEQEYIVINKTLSHGIYKRILAQEPGQFFDENPQPLKDLCRLCWSEFQVKRSNDSRSSVIRVDSDQQ